MDLADLKWPEVGRLSKDTPVVIPVAALEQHGLHLPVFTDSMLLGEVIRRVKETMSEKILFTPLMWLGNSHHHLDFSGTMSASPRVYLDLLIDLTENMLMHGFRRILFLNGHGGNITPGKQAVFELRQKYRDRTDLLLLFSTYWENGIREALAGRSDLVQKDMGHACEWETSMIMRIAPQLVGDIRNLHTVDAGYAFEPAYRGWITKDRTVPGHIGSPEAANTDKGEYLFQTFAKGVCRLLQQVIDWDGRSWQS